jgi:hypothetical protein
VKDCGECSEKSACVFNKEALVRYGQYFSELCYARKIVVRKLLLDNIPICER